MGAHGFEYVAKKDPNPTVFVSSRKIK